MTLSLRSEQALPEWIPVKSCLYGVRLSRSIKVNANRHDSRCLFITSAYAPTDCSSEEEKDDFYRALSRLICSVRSSDIVIVAGDMNAQVGRLHSFESHLGSHFSVGAPRTDNRDRLLQLCTDDQLYLASTNFQHKRLHRVSWKPSCATQTWTQLDHFAVSRRWRSSIQDCRLFWCTPPESDHAMLRGRLSIKFPGVNGSNQPSNQHPTFTQLLRKSIG